MEAALFFGPAGEQERRGFSVRFWVAGSGESGVSLARGFGEDAFSKRTDFNRSVPFSVRMANHRLRVLANQGQWIADQPLPAGVTIDNGASIGLGSTCSGGGIVQFRNLQWRTTGSEP